MLGMMKTKNPHARAAHDVYATILSQTRIPAFYTQYGVTDNFESRFELLCLHAFAVIHVVLEEGADESFNQALFDIMFADIDQSLRQTGKGDMGVPKHMRRMMKGFNGRMSVYHEHYGDRGAFTDAVRRNLYAERADAPADEIVAYMRKTVEGLNISDILSGDIKLQTIK